MKSCNGEAEDTSAVEHRGPGEHGHPFGSVRQGRGLGADLLQPSPVVGRVARGQVGALVVIDVDFQNVSARRVQEPVAHHGPDVGTE